MIPGYNHNIRYRELVFHVQTEDSGVRAPHVITHVFLGGNIINSRKCSYADVVAKPELVPTVQARMQSQHKAAIKDLISGALDGAIAARSANAVMPGACRGIPDRAIRSAVEPAARSENVAAGQARSSVGVATSAPATPVAPAGAVRPKVVVAQPAPDLPEYAAEVVPVIDAETLRRAFSGGGETLSDSMFGPKTGELPLDQVILDYLEDKKEG